MRGDQNGETPKVKRQNRYATGVKNSRKYPSWGWFLA
jgi:hypothetical protein